MTSSAHPRLSPRNATAIITTITISAISISAGAVSAPSWFSSYGGACRCSCRFHMNTSLRLLCSHRSFSGFSFPFFSRENTRGAEKEKKLEMRVNFSPPSGAKMNVEGEGEDEDAAGAAAPSLRWHREGGGQREAEKRRKNELKEEWEEGEKEEEERLAGTVVDWIAHPPPSSLRAVCTTACTCTSTNSRGDVKSDLFHKRGDRNHNDVGGSNVIVKEKRGHHHPGSSPRVVKEETRSSKGQSTPSSPPFAWSNNHKCDKHSSNNSGGDEAVKRELFSPPSASKFPMVLKGVERAKFLSALAKVKYEEWIKSRERQLAVQQEEAERSGSHLPPRMEEAIHVESERIQAALRYAAQLELVWIEEWAMRTENRSHHHHNKRNTIDSEEGENDTSSTSTTTTATATKIEKKRRNDQKGEEKNEEMERDVDGRGSNHHHRYSDSGGGSERHEISAETRLLVKRALLERVDYRKPLAYIIGSQAFYGCSLSCEYPVPYASEQTMMWVYWLVEKYWKPAFAAIRSTAVSTSTFTSSLNTPTEKKETRRDRLSSSSSFSTTTSANSSLFFFPRSPSSSSASSVIPPLHILDMCCGNGAIGIALAKQWPGQCCVVGVDIDAQAIALAKRNAAANGMIVFRPDEQGVVRKEMDGKTQHGSSQRDRGIPFSSVQAPGSSTATTTMATTTPTTTRNSRSTGRKEGGMVMGEEEAEKGGSGVVRRYWGIQGDMFRALCRNERKAAEFFPSSPTSPPSFSSSTCSFLHESEKKSGGDGSSGNSDNNHEKDSEDDLAFMARELSPEFIAQFDLVVCHPPYLLPREYDELSLQEQYWKPPVSVLGDSTRRGVKQYRYFKELSECSSLVLRSTPLFHIPSSLSPPLHDSEKDGGERMPQLVVEVGRQAALVAELLERQPPILPRAAAAAQIAAAAPVRGKTGPGYGSPPPSSQLPPHHQHPLSSLSSNASVAASHEGEGSDMNAIKTGVAWKDVEVHLDANQLPRWICARRA